MVFAAHFNIAYTFSAVTSDALKKSIAFMCCTGCMLLCQPAYTENNGRIVKWKDEKGVTHYGDKIPPQYSNRENSLMNKQGITVQQNKIAAPENTSIEQAQIDQEKRDKALLGTFSNAEEIDLTRDRNLETDLMVMKNMQQDRAISQKKYDKLKAQAQTYINAKKPVPENLRGELNVSQLELAKIDQKISARQQSIDAIRQRFDEDKKRYLYLREKNTQPN